MTHDYHPCYDNVDINNHFGEDIIGDFIYNKEILTYLMKNKAIRLNLYQNVDEETQREVQSIIDQCSFPRNQFQRIPMSPYEKHITDELEIRVNQFLGNIRHTFFGGMILSIIVGIIYENQIILVVGWILANVITIVHEIFFLFFLKDNKYVLLTKVVMIFCFLPVQFSIVIALLSGLIS